MSSKKDHINVSIVFQGQEDQVIDLRLPIHITVTRLIKEIYQIVGRPFFPEAIHQLKIKNKGILLEDYDVLAQYPITNGDFIEISSGGKQHV